MRTHRGTLPANGFGGASDRRREPDAVLRVAHIVVHRFWNGNHLEAGLIEFGRIAQRVVAPDGDQVFELQLLQILEYLRCQVVYRAGFSIFRHLRRRKGSATQKFRHLFHLGRIGAGGVQERAAGAVDRARIAPVQRQNIARSARGIIQVDMRQPFPASPDTDHFTTDFTASIDHALDHRVQAGNVTTAGENPHTFYRHQNSSLSW